MDMKVLAHPTQVASASMEPTVLLWDPATSSVVHEWKVKMPDDAQNILSILKVIA